MTSPSIDQPSPGPVGLSGGKHLPWRQRLRFAVLRIPRRLTRIPDSPHAIAKAFSVGVFIGVMPGLGPLAAIVTALAFRLSKTATLLGSLITNPWTVAAVYAASYRVGQWILPSERPVHWETLYRLNAGWWAEMSKVFPSMILGGLIIGALMAMFFYFPVLVLVKRYKQTRLNRLNRKPG